MTAVLVSFVAFAMSLAISAAYYIRQQLVSVMAANTSLKGAYIIYGSFNAFCSMIASLCVLFGAARASGSGLPVRKRRILSHPCT
jgi:hypothetical protein